MRFRTAVQHGFEAPAFENLESRRMFDGSPPDDIYEPNDLPREVNPRPEGVVNSPNIGAVVGTKVVRNLKLIDSADIFKFRILSTGTSADYTRINFNSARGNLDLELLGAAGRVLRQSITNGNPENISLAGLPPAIYFVRVTGRNGEFSPNYTITINGPSEAVNPNEDAYESNDTFGEVDAKPVGGLNSPNLGQKTGLTFVNNLKLNDTYDIYKFTMTTTGSAPSFIRVNSASPLNLIVFNSSGTILRTADAYLGQDTLSLSQLTAGDYYVQVTHFALGRPGVFNYSLTFQL